MKPAAVILHEGVRVKFWVVLGVYLTLVSSAAHAGWSMEIAADDPNGLAFTMSPAGNTGTFTFKARLLLELHTC
jgi:hypothetical protein